MAKANEYNVTRAYDRKDMGRVGIVELTASVESITINGKALPPTSIEYLLNFSLQNLQDAYAGADSLSDAVERFDKKMDKLLAGTIGVRESGNGVSEETQAVRGVIGDMLRQAKQWKERIGKLDDDKRGDALDAIFAAQSEEKQEGILATARERIAQAKARKEQAKQLATGLAL